MLRVMILCTASASNLYFLPVCGATDISFSYHVNWLMLSGTEFWHITYDGAIPLAPTIISKWRRISISHLSYWISDSNLTWKSSVIIYSPFIFCSILHDYHLLASLIIVRSVYPSTSSNILVVSLSRRWSLTHYMSGTSLFLYTHDYLSSIRGGYIGLPSIFWLEPLHILVNYVSDPFVLGQHVFLDAVSWSLYVNAQHSKDFVSFLFDWWCLHFLVAGKLLRLINPGNIFVAII